MELSALPGVTNKQLLESLTIVLNQAKAAHNLQGDVANMIRNKYEAYCKWAMDSVGIMSRLIGQGDIERLIATPRHWSLVGASVIQGNESNSVIYLVNTELSQRIQELEGVIQAIGNEISKWQIYDGELMIPDTNVFLHENDFFDEIDWRQKLDIRRYTNIHLVIPILVIGELDRKKRLSKGNPVSNTNSMEVRSRARLTLKKIDAFFPNPTWMRMLEQGNEHHGSISMTLLLDGLRHIRLPDPDSEILDRALSLEQATGKKVTIVTKDVSMSLSARSAGLQSKLLSSEYEEG